MTILSLSFLGINKFISSLSYVKLIKCSSISYSKVFQILELKLFELPIDILIYMV